jgi:hypothetical protein
MKALGVLSLMLIGVAGLLTAAPPPFAAPEIDPVSGMNAVAMFFGAGLMLRRSRKS